MPIGFSTFNEAVDKYPEYFPEEVEHKKKWETIPKNVHDAYWAEWSIMHAKMYKEMPPSKGIVYWVDHPEEYAQWSKLYDAIRPMEVELEKKLHDKHYAQYGL